MKSTAKVLDVSYFDELSNENIITNNQILIEFV